MKKKLFLVTDNFPYGEGEKTFVEPELLYLKEKYDVTIVSCADDKTKCEVSSATPLESDIQLLSLVPTGSKLKKFKYFIFALLSLSMWNEWIKIVRERNNTLPKLRYALWHYISAEAFYNQLNRAVDLQNASVYTYWNNIRTLGICCHKHEHKGLKVITRVHGCDLYNERGLGGRQYFRWLVNQHLDAIFFVSQKGLAYYRDTFKVKDTKKLFFRPLGIFEMPMSHASKNSDEFVLVSCSSVIPLKRVDLIVKGLSKVNSRCHITWIHFGDGSEMSRVRKLAHELLGERSQITYKLWGRENNEKIRQYYASHVVSGFITTSSTEGVPVSIQEALCAAVPIIGTNVGGIPEMIDGNGILLTKNPTAEEVAGAIKKLAELPVEEQSVWRQRSRGIWQKKFMAEKNYRNFIKTLESIIG